MGVKATVSWRDVLRAPGDGRFRHDRVGVRGLVHGLEFEPLVVDPQVGRFEVFGVSLVLVGAIGRFGCSSFPGGENTHRGYGDADGRTSPLMN